MTTTQSNFRLRNCSLIPQSQKLMCENLSGACLSHEGNFHLISCPQTPRSVWCAFYSRLLCNVQWSAGAFSMDNRGDRQTNQLTDWQGGRKGKEWNWGLYSHWLNWSRFLFTTIKGVGQRKRKLEGAVWTDEENDGVIINIDKEYFNFWIVGLSLHHHRPTIEAAEGQTIDGILTKWQFWACVCLLFDFILSQGSDNLVGKWRGRSG